MDKDGTEMEEPSARITRARAKALGAAGGGIVGSFKQEQKRTNTKRAASHETKVSAAPIAGLHLKRRAVLKDVSNIPSHLNCINDAHIQARLQPKRCPAKKNALEGIDVTMEIPLIEDDAKAKLAEDLSKIRMAEPQEHSSPEELEKKRQRIYHDTLESSAADMVPILARIKTSGHKTTQIKEEEMGCELVPASSVLDVVDIDSKLKDPKLYCLYAPDIFNNIRVKELDQRPSADYMEQLQHDITPSMRGILIDWLVEVSEEYKLGPDTLYLTVNLIDRFLSKNYIEKQRLQLLGVTCMLIASKYEEISAPRVEEFCFITDNTYTKEEVLKMESVALNFLYFQLAVPTTITFLRRFIQAAQATVKNPCLELEFLANYFAELTLVEYNFLNFLPSLVAASAVFLARWTLNQSDHPWNPTLEHYTAYKASELKTAVLALEDLQLNNDSSLKAIRDKYGLQKFKSVASLASPQRVSTLF